MIKSSVILSDLQISVGWSQTIVYKHQKDSVELKNLSVQQRSKNDSFP